MRCSPAGTSVGEQDVISGSSPGASGSGRSGTRCCHHSRAQWHVEHCEACEHVQHGCADVPVHSVQCELERVRGLDGSCHVVRATAKELAMSDEPESERFPIACSSCTSLDVDSQKQRNFATLNLHPNSTPQPFPVPCHQEHISELPLNDVSVCSRSRSEEQDVGHGDLPSTPERRKSDEMADDPMADPDFRQAERQPMTSRVTSCFGLPLDWGGKKWGTCAGSRHSGEAEGRESDLILRKSPSRKPRSSCFINILRCWCVPGLDTESSDEEEENVLLKDPYPGIVFPAIATDKSSSHQTRELTMP